MFFECDFEILEFIMLTYMHMCVDTHVPYVAVGGQVVRVGPFYHVGSGGQT